MRVKANLPIAYYTMNKKIVLPIYRQLNQIEMNSKITFYNLDRKINDINIEINKNITLNIRYNKHLCTTNTQPKQKEILVPCLRRCIWNQLMIFST